MTNRNQDPGSNQAGVENHISSAPAEDLKSDKRGAHPCLCRELTDRHDNQQGADRGYVPGCITRLPNFAKGIKDEKWDHN